MRRRSAVGFWTSRTTVRLPPRFRLPDANGDERGITVESITVIPLDMVNTILVVLPKETTQYPAGAVLLYTEAQLG